jgi:membrane dipeptidase
MFILDAHQDIAYNAICYGRDYRNSALKTRELEVNSAVPEQNGVATIGLPEALAGRVAVTIATIFTAKRNQSTGHYPQDLFYETDAEAYQMGMAQWDYYQRLLDSDSRLRLILSNQDLDDVLATWADDAPESGRLLGLALSMENADPITEPRQFEEWHARGLRLVGPAWQASRYCGGTSMPGGLTKLGYELLDVMARFNAVLDLSHMAEEAFYQSLDAYQGTSIIASHSNPRKFCDTDRHLSDDMIRKLAERDGVMGINFANYFLKKGWTRQDGKQAITMDWLLDVIDHVCQVTGSVRHVGIGTDFDGGFGSESIPAPFDTMDDLWKLKDSLAERGFSEADISAILSGNMIRKLREGLA